MSVNNVAHDFAQLDFNVPTSSQLLPQQPPVNIIRSSIAGRATRRNRNRQCVPSDDEDEDEDDEDEDDAGASSDEDDHRIKKPIQQQQQVKTQHKPRKTQPLPSDGEDSSDEGGQSVGDSVKREASEGHHNAFYGSSSSRNNHNNNDSDDGAVLGQHARVPASTEGSHLPHLQHLQQMQHYHQQQLAQFQHHLAGPPAMLVPSTSSHLMRPVQHQQRVSMSGMDLLKQLEREKADAKRQKPKINPSKVRIEGLLANLPEPGSHSISFQQIQQQQNQQNQHPQQQQQQYGPKKARSIGRPSSSHGFLDVSPGHAHQSRSASPDHRSYVAYPPYPPMSVDMAYANTFLQTPLFGYQQPYMMNGGIVPRPSTSSTLQDAAASSSQRRFATPLAEQHTHS